MGSRRNVLALPYFHMSRSPDTGIQIQTNNGASVKVEDFRRAKFEPAVLINGFQSEFTDALCLLDGV